MDKVGDYKRQSSSRGGQDGSRGRSGQPVSSQARARAIARRKRRRRQRRIIIGVVILLFLALILAAVFGLSGQSKRKKQQTLIDQGTEYLDQGNYDSAIGAFEEALAISKGKIGKSEQTVLQFRAEAEYNKKDYATALATYQTLLETDGNNDKYKQMQSLCQMQLGDYEAALTYQPNAAVIYNRIAVQAYQENRYEEALTAIDQGIATGEPLVMQDLMFNQAAVYEKMGDFAKALELYEAYKQTYGSDQDLEKEIAFLKTRQEE